MVLLRECIAVQMNSSGWIHFYDGSLLVSACEAMYFGNEINQEMNVRYEIIDTCKKFDGPGTS